MYQRILLPVDLNEKIQVTITTAVDYAKQFGASLHILTVIPDFGKNIAQYFPGNADDRIMAGAGDALKKFAAQHVPSSIQAETSVAQGTVYEVIIEAAERLQSDLIIMGAHRPELKDYLLGTNASRVVRHSQRSVLILREPLTA